MISDDDVRFMISAIEVAKESKQEPGPPRPKVGAVLVDREGRELGRAFRGETGPGHHAEYCLLEQKLGTHDQVPGGTLYTTLEPCTERGPGKVACADRIADRKLSRVIIGMLDPNQNICGRGIRRLRHAMIDVDLFPAELMKRVEDQNREFIRDQERKKEVAALAEAAQIINPRFDDDLARLDKDFKIESVANTGTVFVVAGDSIPAELLDRPTCALLRQEIDTRGKGLPFRRALLIGAATWLEHGWITKRCAAVCVGGPHVNAATKDIVETAAPKNMSPFPLGPGEGIFLSEPRPRAALYGKTAKDTRAAVEKYIMSPRGLEEFLGCIWR